MVGPTPAPTRLRPGRRLLVACALLRQGASAAPREDKDTKGMPVAVFHGMGASAGIENGEIVFLKQNLLEGDGWRFFSVPYAEGRATITTSIQKQAENACSILQQTDEFKSAEQVSLIGHSNGGMVSRWVLQNCDIGQNGFKTRVAYYISVGAPQRGITMIPRDHVPTSLLPLLDWIVKKAYLWSHMQNTIGPAGYVYNPMKMEAFRKANTFLGKLNNEADVRDFKQRDRVKNLDGMLLIKFAKDTVVEPKDTEWFAQVAEDGKTIVPVDLSGEFWDADAIGLRHLKEQGKLFFAEAPREHDKLEDEDRGRWMLPLLRGERPPLDVRAPERGLRLGGDEKKGASSAVLHI